MSFAGTGYLPAVLPTTIRELHKLQWKPNHGLKCSESTVHIIYLGTIILFQSISIYLIFFFFYSVYWIGIRPVRTGVSRVASWSISSLARSKVSVTTAEITDGRRELLSSIIVAAVYRKDCGGCSESMDASSTYIIILLH